jgi:hypothetical protein
MLASPVGPVTYAEPIGTPPTKKSTDPAGRLLMESTTGAPIAGFAGLILSALAAALAVVPLDERLVRHTVLRESARGNKNFTTTHTYGSSTLSGCSATESES